MRLGAVLLAGLLGLALLSGCEAKAPAPAPPQGKIPDVRLGTVEMTEVKDAVTQWQLAAASIEYERATGRGDMLQVQVTFFSQKGEPVFVQSERGVFDSIAKEIELIGNVHGTASPYLLSADRLRYRPKERVLETPTAARMESKDLTVAGVGLHYDIDSGRFHIDHEVKSRANHRLF
jgi:LPS export ABC transporter protein LptC